MPTEFGLTAPPAASSVPFVVLSSRLLGMHPLAWPSPAPRLRSHAADPVYSFRCGEESSGSEYVSILEGVLSPETVNSP